MRVLRKFGFVLLLGIVFTYSLADELLAQRFRLGGEPEKTESTKQTPSPTPETEPTISSLSEVQPSLPPTAFAMVVFVAGKVLPLLDLLIGFALFVYIGYDQIDSLSFDKRPKEAEVVPKHLQAFEAFDKQEHERRLHRHEFRTRALKVFAIWGTATFSLLAIIAGIESNQFTADAYWGLAVFIALCVGFFSQLAWRRKARAAFVQYSRRNRVRVRLSTGQTGTINEEDFDAATMTRI